MKILFASHSSYTQGGAQGVLFDLVKGIKQFFPDYQIYVIFPEKGALIDVFLPYINGYAVIKQPGWMIEPDRKSLYKSLWNITRFMRYAWKALGYMNQIKPDVVMTNTIFSPVAALASKWGKYRHLWFIHEIPVKSKSYTFLYPESMLVRWVGSHSDKILAVSNSIQKHYKPLLATADKICRIHYSVEINKDVKFERKDFRYTLLLVGNFDENKGQKEAIEACRILKEKSHLSFRLLLVGAGEDAYSDAMRQLVKEENLDKEVEIVSFTTDIFPFYKQADVLLMCSASEGLPKTVVEAQKFGLPVIATAIEANEELVISEYNGLFYHRGNLNELVSAIERMSSSELRAEMGKNAMSFMGERYRLKQFVEEFVGYCRL